MKKIYFLLISLFFLGNIHAQTVTVSGQCISGTINLTYQGVLDGKPYYEAYGTVAGIPNIQVDIYWMGSPDNLWVLAFSGQPYFSNSCATSTPPGTANPSCTWDVVPGEPCTGGAALSITGAVVLPVTLGSFSATKAGASSLLKWNTFTEMNNRGFEIQKSNDGISWNNIGFVNSKGNSSTEVDYQFTDASTYAGKNFYRLRQVDLDGHSVYSSVASLDFNNSRFYTIANNPGNGIYTISMTSGSESVELKVLDVNGKVVYIKNTNLSRQILNISKYAAGVYLLQLKKGNDIYTEKLLKTN
ncbi:MAG: T9SS type A sorting domain-containing protein [Ferruginibacter sp.]